MPKVFAEITSILIVLALVFLGMLAVAMPFAIAARWAKC